MTWRTLIGKLHQTSYKQSQSAVLPRPSGRLEPLGLRGRLQRILGQSTGLFVPEDGRFSMLSSLNSRFCLRRICCLAGRDSGPYNYVK
jgi:hypothetical protein